MRVDPIAWQLLLFGGSVLVGFLVGRWWVPLVPLLLGIVVFVTTPDVENNDIPSILAVFTGAELAVCMLVGVIIAKLTRKPSGPRGPRLYPPS